MRIGVIGAGHMARALGAGWVRAGHQVMLGGRTPERAVKAADHIGPGATGGGLREAAAYGEVTLLAVPGEAVTEALLGAGAGDGAFNGRPLIDCTNAFAPGAFAQPPDSFTLTEPALAERVAEVAVGARVVKAFNLCAAEVYESGGWEVVEGRELGVPMCGNDAWAMELVSGLAADLGFHPLPAGGLGRARYLEAATALVVGMWFAGLDARTMLPPLASAAAVPDDDG